MMRVMGSFYFAHGGRVEGEVVMTPGRWAWERKRRRGMGLSGNRQF